MKHINLESLIRRLAVSAVGTALGAHFVMGIDLWTAPATAQIVALGVVVAVIVSSVLS